MCKNKNTCVTAHYLASSDDHI